MVELRTLTPSVLVRIQLPQPKIKTPWWRFCFWFVAMVQSCDEYRLVRKQVDLTSSPQPAQRAVRGYQLPQPPFASVTMRWQAKAEQFTRRSATRSFNEVWQTHLILNIIKTPWWRFCFWFVAMVQSCDEYRLVRKQVDLTSWRWFNHAMNIAWFENK